MADDATTPVETGDSGAAEQQGESSVESTTSTSLLGEDSAQPAGTEPEDNSTLEGDPDKDKSPLDDEGEEGGEGSDESEKDGPPEKYESFELPEGMPMNEAALERAEPMFRELGLSQEQAQKAVTMHAELLQDMEQQQKQQLISTREGWKKELQADSSFPETAANAKKVVETFGDDGVKGLLYNEWLGDNPHLVRFLGKIGAAMNDDNFVSGAGSPGATGELPDRMFGDMPGLPR